MKMYLLRNLRFAVRPDYVLEDEVAGKLRLSRAAFRIEKIVRKAIDTRRSDHPYYDFTLLLAMENIHRAHKDLAEYQAPEPVQADPIMVADPHPFIIGMGPAGLFCALAMVEKGLQPHLFDLGDPLETRAAKVRDFWQNGLLDENSNVQFGEGGAGAFSDGKLTSRSNDPSIEQVFAAMIRFGAPEEIGWEALPHLGTEGIRSMVKRIRQYLQSQGCKFIYRCALEDVEVAEGRVKRVQIGGLWYNPETIVLALGNSSRKTFRMLHERGLMLEPKSFALGLRIEQDQARINRLIYGSERWSGLLGPATYRLTAPTGFTFCMCPGGQVIASSSEARTVVTNGMSFASRNNAFCNSAVVTPVSSADYGAGLWAGMDFQVSLERASFHDRFFAPAQLATSFIEGSPDQQRHGCTYQPGVYSRELGELFPAQIRDRLISSLKRFSEILPGFCQSALLIAPETRTSSPIRILRDRNLLHSLSARNLYPIGEGSGYAGGIVSSAADGWRLGARMNRMGN